MLYRKIESKIKNWVNNETNALLIEGARQVGKTYIIRKVLKEMNCNYIEINLIKNPEFIGLLKNIKGDLTSFTNFLTLFSNSEIKEGETILFLDEVQEFKEIITYVKFLVEANKFKIILSGSLLGVELFHLKSAPVGYLNTLKMYPLDFEEFAINSKVSSNVLNELKDAFEKKIKVNDALHEKMLMLFRTYLIIGGMPQAVISYLINNDFNRVDEIHKNIIEQYKLDFTKYEKTHRLKLINIYDLIPTELADNNKRFKFNDIKYGARYDKYENSFNWLIDAGVAIPVHNLNEVRLPLKINKKSTLFKFFMSDIGLLTSCYDNSTKIALLSDTTNINAGAIYENVVAQELLAHDFNIYYYNSHSLGELDFVIEYKGNVLPIEVKSGKDYKRHNALDNVLSNVGYGIKEAFVLSKGNVEIKDKLVYLPIYMVMFIKDDQKIVLPKIDFSEFE